MNKYSIALIGVVGIGLILLMGGPAWAGDYHRGATLICSDCHVMHFSQTHGYNANGGGLFTPLGPGTDGYAYLLRNEVNELCLTCHDGQAFAPDVLEANTGTGVRQAGALNRGGVTPYYNATGHTLDTMDTAPGGTWTPGIHGLTCVDCHAPHARGGPTVNNAYRNLSPTAGGLATFDPPSYAIGTNDTTKDVYETAAGASDVANVNFNEPDQTKSAYGNWCNSCHSSFHGGPGSANTGGIGTPAEEFDRHPTAGVDIGALGGGHSSRSVFAIGARSGTGPGPKINWVKVMTATGNWTPDMPSEVTDHTPSCMSCHKAHGNRNAFGLVQMNPLSGAVTEEGTAGGTYKNLCAQCHTQAL